MPRLLPDAPSSWISVLRARVAINERATQGGSALIDGPIYFEADYLEIDHLTLWNDPSRRIPS